MKKTHEKEVVTEESLTDKSYIFQKEVLSFEAPLPQDMQSILRELREQFAIGGVE